MTRGNKHVAVCPRGVGGGPSYRHVLGSIWSPDIMVIPAIDELSNLLTIYDPSHSTGYRNFVKSISKAALAAGANGLIIEAHPNPDDSVSDPDQAITFDTLGEIFEWSDSNTNFQRSPKFKKLLNILTSKPLSMK